MANYDELDGILNNVEQFIPPLVTQYELTQVSIERWRWDEPVITLSWVGGDDISRNIHALVTEGSSSTYELAVEINAWQDEDREEGKVRVRNWYHEEVERCSVPPNGHELQEILNTACMKVIGWTRETLTEQTHVASRAVRP